MGETDNRFVKVFFGGLGLLLVVDILILDFVWITGAKKQVAPVSTSVMNFPTQAQSKFPVNEETCIPSCKDFIQQEVTRLIPTSSALEETPTPVPSGSVTGMAKVTYIPITTARSTAIMDWTDANPSDFYFDLVDFPGAKSVRWEVYLQAVNGSGKVFARLYDVTNKRGVDYSELATESNTSVFLRSSDLKIWRGNNLYRVQLKSVNGTEAVLAQARLKIIF